MNDQRPVRYYQFSLTGGQMVVAFVVSIGLLAAAFFFGFQAAPGGGGGGPADGAAPAPATAAATPTDGGEPGATPDAEPSPATTSEPPPAALGEIGSELPEGGASAEPPASPAPPAAAPVSAAPAETSKPAAVPRKAAETARTPAAKPPDAATKPAAARAPAGKGSSWTVQVAALGSKEKAEALRRRLEKSYGSKVTVESIEVRGKKLFAVRVGAYREKGEAERMASRLKGAEKQLKETRVVER